MAAIANLYLEAGDRDSFVRWVDRAILDAAGRKAAQDALVACKQEYRPVDTRQLIGLPSTRPGDQGGDTASLTLEVGHDESPAADPQPPLG
jgi:hypothetical protein